jgi:tRNA uridine 5-carbamoylmethylation protein Kti12
VQEIKQLVQLQRSSFPVAAADLDKSLSELVKSTKAVLEDCNTAEAEGQQRAKSEFTTVVAGIREKCVKTLEPRRSIA